MDEHELESEVIESTATAPATARPPTTTTTPAKPAATTTKPATTTAKPATTTAKPATTSGTPATTASSKPASPASQPASPAAGGKSGKSLFDQISSIVPKAIDFAKFGLSTAQQGKQIAQMFRGGPAAAPTPAAEPTSPTAAGALPGAGVVPYAPEPAPAAAPFGAPVQASEPTAAPAPAAAPLPAPSAGVDQVSALLQALQQRQVPPLPGAVGQAAAVGQAPAADGLALLRLILGNSQLQQAFLAPQQPGFVPRSVALPVPAASYPHRMRSMPIPLGAVMNAIAALAGQSMTELNAGIGEDEEAVPSYLIGEDGQFLVDPASAPDRAALVTHLFRVSDAAQRQPWDVNREPDDSDAFARDAGLAM